MCASVHPAVRIRRAQAEGDLACEARGVRLERRAQGALQADHPEQRERESDGGRARRRDNPARQRYFAHPRPRSVPHECEWPQATQTAAFPSRTRARSQSSQQPFRRRSNRTFFGGSANSPRTIRAEPSCHTACDLARVGICCAGYFLTVSPACWQVPTTSIASTVTR